MNDTGAMMRLLTQGFLGVALALPLAVGAFGTARAQAPTNRPLLGVEGRALDAQEATRYRQGVMVVGVVSGSVAQAAGVQVGDVILAVDGQPVSDGVTLVREVVDKHQLGDRVALRIVRNDTPRDLTVQLGGMVSNPAAWGVYMDLAEKKWLLEPDRRDILSFEWVERDHLRQTLRPFGPQVGTYRMDITYSKDRDALVLTYSWGEAVPGQTAADGSVTFRGKTKLFVSDQRGFRRRPDGRIEYWVEHAGSQVYPLVQTDAATEERMLADQRERIEAEKRRKEERSERFSAAMGALYGALSEANAIADANEAQSHAQLDDTLNALARQQQGAHTGTAISRAYEPTSPGIASRAMPQAPSPSAPSASKPLRFVLDISLSNRPGDSVNPTCYSNVITRPGPPGWGSGGSLPPDSTAQAQQLVESVKAAFIAKCTASGRAVTSTGDFHWSWNRTADEEQRLQGIRARYPEDVSVSVD